MSYWPFSLRKGRIDWGDLLVLTSTTSSLPSFLFSWRFVLPLSWLQIYGQWHYYYAWCSYWNGLNRIIISLFSCGGNLLLNIPPTAEGIITPIYQERLLDIGRFLAVNGEAVYASTTYHTANDPVTENVWWVKWSAPSYKSLFIREISVQQTIYAWYFW